MPGNIPTNVIPIVAIVSGCAVAIFYPLARAYARRMEHSGAATPPEVLARLERIEHAIESIAVEVERVSEGQRFTTKLLSEQKAPALEPGSERR